MIKLIENDIIVDEYLDLRDRVNWKKLSRTQAQRALDNCLYVVKAVDDDGTPIGMGRIVGDGSVICYIQDLIVVPEAQGQGVGTKIITALKKYVDNIREDGTTMMLCLMCAKGREEFYIKNDFIPRPTDELGPGMIMYMAE
ncbi:MAG: GNAT family N-acetyltransferase [Lachnospiraceae bacterium]|nr:GNAT family N-acetyltransferase [Lachnospiraceae bacterium]